MNELLKMAQDFEKNSKEQADLTKQSVSKDFNALNKFISSEVKKSAKEMRNAMEELNEHHLSKYKKTRMMLLLVVLIAAIFGGMYLQKQINLLGLRTTKATTGETLVICQRTQMTNDTIYCLPE